MQSIAPSTTPAAGPAAWQRLVALADDRLSRLFGLRFARFGAFFIALGYAIAIVSVAGVSGSRPGLLVVRALGWLSWVVAGPAALAAARDLALFDERDGMTDLLATRGFPPAALGSARTLAAAFRIGRLTAVPALLLALLVLLLARSLAQFESRALLCAAVVGYGALLGGVLGVLSRWSAALSPTHGKSVLLAILFVPELVKQAWPGIPSLPSFFGRMLEALRAIGGAA